MHWAVETVLIVVIGTIIMRIGGRKSISQMTIAQTVVIISIGKVLIEPVATKDVGQNFLIAAVMVAVLLSIEFIMLKSKTLKNIIGGKPVVVIQDGSQVRKNMRKLRMPKGELEARLRQHGIQSISDIEYATIDPNGELGFRWKKEKHPSTNEDIKQLHDRLERLENLIKERTLK
ncbi:hypothetical protein CIB95_09200 [Lottiidibacillus patelloidae]|uniref:YetF C-terminal domain-containing protein n=1 Tax=Lottiidibacillus patelloidae TaxID=2670334 RepID=A0A263BUT2_9BACI|nr:YetF domain-containing protein [Lottiidibacillus patelloidae]OZM56936.1 hypothetical protein CIB95_09200 [Lottiidibacillus patelloidae]